MKVNFEVRFFGETGGYEQDGFHVSNIPTYGHPLFPREKASKDTFGELKYT